jgi:hypothetical protein
VPVSLLVRCAIFTAAVLVGLSWLLFVRDTGGGETERRMPVREASRTAAVIAVLGDDVDAHNGRLRGAHVARVVRISLPAGRIEAARRLGPRLRHARRAAPGAFELSFSGQLLASGPDARTVYALARQGERDHVEVLEATSLDTRRRYPLARGVHYTGMTLGRSGRIYAYGSRHVAAGRSVPTLTILDPDSVTVATHSVPGRTDRDWSVHAGALAADERRFLLTYHGGNTTGADWIDLAPGALRRCASRESDKACIFEIHGGVEPYRDGFLATTGSRVLEVSREGHILRQLPLAPRNVHLMDFVRDRSQLYVSSCGQRPAILGLDLLHDRVQTMRSGRFCGAPFAVGAGFLVISADRVRRDYAGDNPRLRVIELADVGAGVPVHHRGRPLDAVIVGARQR